MAGGLYGTTSNLLEIIQQLEGYANGASQEEMFDYLTAIGKVGAGLQQAMAANDSVGRLFGKRWISNSLPRAVTETLYPIQLHDTNRARAVSKIQIDRCSSMQFPTHQEAGPNIICALSGFVPAYPATKH